MPPAQKNWWDVPVGRQEILWIGIALVWCMILFFMMPYWHMYGKQNISNEAYRVTPAKFQAKVDEMVKKYTVRTETAMKIPVVAPPEGEEIFLLSRLWSFYPMLELKKDVTYRMHLTSLDWNHGFSLQPVNINIQVVPGYVMVLNITPDKAGEYTIVCNEYCGIGHHTMLGKIWVKE
jgi:cytochrome c oxidase subunit 2